MNTVCKHATAPQTNPDTRPRSEPTLKLHSRAVSKCRRHVTVPAEPTQEAIPGGGPIKK